MQGLRDTWTDTPPYVYNNWIQKGGTRLAYFSLVL